MTLPRIEWVVETNEELDLEYTQTLAAQVLADHEATGEVTILLTDDRHLQDLNREFRNIDSPTDVLSFELTDPVHPESDTLGELYISLDRAASQAMEAQRPLSEEVTHLAIHGVLHLLGFDHQTDTDHLEMVRRETRYLSQRIQT